ncbi:MAG: hypothetical protein OCC49_10480 [Fibrobacterales bacterium]
MTSVKSESVATAIGPMLHWDQEGNLREFTIEVSAWTFQNSGKGVGVDFGISLFRPKVESSLHKNFRLYSEFQVGAIVAGTSLGPYLEFATEGAYPINIGIQNTNWLCVFVGKSYRFQFSFRGLEYKDGWFVKIPQSDYRMY